MYQFIQQQQQLNAVLEAMRQHPIYALDTEFIKVDTLWPKLGVLQINIAEEIFLLDGVNL
ncbi:MAG: ribonuclease D, partial [Acinetobacter sp.]